MRIRYIFPTLLLLGWVFTVSSVFSLEATYYSDAFE